MILLPGWPVPGRPIDTDVPSARQAIAEHYPLPVPDRSLRVNLVTTVDGAVRGGDGSSASLSGGADRAVLGAIRRISDAVLVGASTLRAEPGLLPRNTPLVVITRSGELGGFSVDPGRQHGPILVVGPPSARDQAAETMSAPHEYLSLDVEPKFAVVLPSLLDQLAERGMRHVVCEGGPTLVRALIGLRLVDELCLTTAPMLADPGAPGLFDGRLDQPQAAPLVGVLADEAGYLYTRRRLR